MHLVTYHHAKTEILPPFSGGMYEYWTAGNGLFVRAARPNLEALIWVAAFAGPVRGLYHLRPYIKLDRKVPGKKLDLIHNRACQGLPNEILFYLLLRDSSIFNPFMSFSNSSWSLSIPEQNATPGNVKPVDPFDKSAKDALIELHSHGHMSAFFSTQDNSDETGFRIYAVIGSLPDQPTLRVRVGIYGHFYEIPASWVFDLPPEIQDALHQEKSP